MATTRFPSAPAIASGARLGYLYLDLTPTNNIDGTTSIKCDLVHRPNYRYGVLDCEVRGSISISVGGVTKELELGDRLNIGTSDYTTIFSQTLTFRRTAAVEFATVNVGDNGGRFKLYYYLGGIGASYAWWDTETDTAAEYRLQLDEISLGSTFASAPGTISTLQEYVAVVSRNSTSYKHRLRFVYGADELWRSELFDTEVRYEIPRDIFEADINTDTLRVTAELTTYFEDEVIGIPAVMDLSILADEDMRPVIAAYIIQPVNEGISGITGFIQTVSMARVSFDTVYLTSTAGARLVSTTMEILGKTYSGNPALTGIIGSSGTIPVTLRATDSRGRVGSVTFSLYVLPYAEPKLSVRQGYPFRSNAAGLLDDSGHYVTVAADAGCSSLDGQNSVSIRAEIGGRSYDVTNGDITVIGGNSISPDETYSLALIATDLLGSSKRITVTLPTRVWAMQFRPNGRGVAFGKAAELNNGLELPAGWTIKIGDTSINEQQLARLLEMIT